MKVTSVEEWSEQLNLSVENINEILKQQKVIVHVYCNHSLLYSLLILLLIAR